MFGFFKRIIDKQIAAANVELKKEFEVRLKKEVEILRIKVTEDFEASQKEDFEFLQTEFKRETNKLCREILAEEIGPEVESMLESQIDQLKKDIVRDVEESLEDSIENTVDEKIREFERDFERDMDEKCQWSNFEEEAEEFFDKRLVEQIQESVERELSDKAEDFVVKDDLVFEIKKELNVRANVSMTDEIETIAVGVVARELPKAIEESLTSERAHLVSAIKIFAAVPRDEK